MNEAVKLQSKGSLEDDSYVTFEFDFKTTHMIITRAVFSKKSDTLWKEEKYFIFYKNIRDVEIVHRPNKDDEKSIIITYMAFENRPLVGMEVGSIKFCMADHEETERLYRELIARVTKAYASLVE